jgi:hypothetical protein
MENSSSVNKTNFYKYVYIYKHGFIIAFECVRKEKNVSNGRIYTWMILCKPALNATTAIIAKNSPIQVYC